MVLARRLADGSVDPTFASGHDIRIGGDTIQFGAGAAVALQADGRIVAVARQSSGCPSIQCPASLAVQRYEADGTPDASFGSGGVALVPVDTLVGVAVRSDGKILVATVSYLMRLLPD